MNGQTSLAKKRRGPKPTGWGQQVVVRMHSPLLSAIDAFIAAEPDPKPSRPEAIRLLSNILIKGPWKTRAEGIRVHQELRAFVQAEIDRCGDDPARAEDATRLKQQRAGLDQVLATFARDVEIGDS